MNFILLAVAVLGVMWIIYGVVSGNWNVWKLVEGADGRPSVSKTQWFLWTGTIVVSYAVLWVARAAGAIGIDAIDDVPANVLTALGLSSATMVAAKGITSAYVDSGRIEKDTVSNGSASHLVKDDGGSPDLSKVQILSFTLLSVVIYIASVAAKVQAIAVLTAKPADLSGYGLPDIDGSLMVLMGLSQAAYLGKKLTSSDTPRLTGLDPASAKPNASVTVRGLSFGAQAGTILLDDAPGPTPKSWKDDEVVFDVPPMHPTRGKWGADGQVAQVQLQCSGRESANALPLTVKPDVQLAVTAPVAAASGTAQPAGTSP